MRVTRCETCSAKLGALSTLFIRREIARDEWFARAYQGVQGHHLDWTIRQVWDYVRSRAPFYPFGAPDAHRFPGEHVDATENRLRSQPRRGGD